MRSIDGSTLAYLQARKGIIAADLLWIVGKNRSTGEDEEMGLWNGLEAVNVTVVSGTTGSNVSRDYYGAGPLLSSDAIPLTADLSIRTVAFRLSQVNEQVELAIRGYEPRLAHVEFHRALFDLETRQLVAAPLPHYIGRIDKAPIVTPASGSEGQVEITVASHMRELTRFNPAKKSDVSQRRRSNDQARKYSGVAGQWQIFWAEKKASQSTESKPPIFSIFPLSTSRRIVNSVVGDGSKQGIIKGITNIVKLR